MTKTMAKLTVVVQRVSEHCRFPLALALAAIVFMLPAISVGLFGDDLVQRLKQFRLAELPPGTVDTGLVSSDSGQFGTVIWNLFGFTRPEEAAAHARDFGTLPWWTSETLKIALWRPFTAFTHWLDYRLFPSKPALMHAHNIAWYALAVFLTATLCRRMGTCSDGGSAQERPSESGAGLKLQSVAWVASLAAVLFLLDKNTYVPVMYVANRGFIISLVFGLLCLATHLRWRTTKSCAWMWLSG